MKAVHKAIAYTTSLEKSVFFPSLSLITASTALAQEQYNHNYSYSTGTCTMYRYLSIG